MLFRNISRCLAPAAYNFYSSAAASHGVKFANLTIASSSRVMSPLSWSSKIFRAQFYSQEATDNLPVVDFNYVKRATSMNEVMIVDVREPDEIKEHGKIPNSVNIPLGSVNATLSMSEKDFQQAFNRTKPNENTELIFYCMIGKRSGKAQQGALNLGFKNAKNYLGSWTDWAQKNQ